MTSKIMSKFSPRLWAMFASVNDNEKSGCPLNSPKSMNNYDLNENSSGYDIRCFARSLVIFQLAQPPSTADVTK